MTIKGNFFFIFLVLSFFFNEIVVASFSDVDLLDESPCVGGVKRRHSLVVEDAKSWEKAPFKRSDIIEYMKLGFDVDGDEALELWECNKARDYYLIYQAEKAMIETCDMVFLKCDCDGDGKITQEDFELSYMSCLKDAKAGWLIKQAIGDRIDNGKAFSGVKNTTSIVDIPEDQQQQQKQEPEKKGKGKGKNKH